MAQRLSAEAVQNATGRDWDEWFAYLDSQNAADLTHKEIVALLGADGGVESGWWCQGITNEFEKHIGRRIVGSTTDADFQIGVQQTFPLDGDAAWDLVTSPDGAGEWLGADGPAPREPGDTVTSSDGHEYELRTIKPGERMRLRRTDGETGATSTVQLTLVPGKTGTSIHFHHDGLADGDEREKMRAHWKTVADRLLSIV
ncbi:MAG: SRPBCC family protein [Solirubrobacterales bacterium]